MNTFLHSYNSLETELLISLPGMSGLQPQDWDIAKQYIDVRTEYVSSLGVNWYDTVHTFFLLVLEAEGR
mgnify:FL=1